MAEQCQLGTSAYFGITAGVLHMTGICLRTPVKRTLDPRYGIYPSNRAARSTDRSQDVFRNDFRNDAAAGSSNIKTNVSVLVQDPSLLDEDIYTDRKSVV